MSVLTINSVEAPVSQDGWSDGVLEIADRARSLSGSYLGTRRAIKRTFGGKLISADTTEAEAFRSIINGEGYGFSFASDLRDDWKGNAGWDGDCSREAGGKYSAGQMSVDSSGTATWGFPTGFPALRWTISLWRLNVATWEHWIKVYGTTTLWKDGVGGVALPAWLSWNGSGISLTGAPTKYSEIAIYPFLMPTTWPAVIAARALALPKPPFIEVAGTFVVVPGTTSYTCRGQALQCESQNRGALDRLQRIPFALEES